MAEASNLQTARTICLIVWGLQTWTSSLLDVATITKKEELAELERVLKRANVLIAKLGKGKA